jgi:hypothetical protein
VAAGQAASSRNATVVSAHGRAGHQRGSQSSRQTGPRAVALALAVVYEALIGEYVVQRLHIADGAILGAGALTPDRSRRPTAPGPTVG